MKQLLLFFLAVLSVAGLNAQVFVDADAGGANDGSSWANAYTDLDDALMAVPSGGAVWVAEGTYTTPADRSFMIVDSITLLGGFVGNETSADAAEPEKNVTILSGDVMGNDVAGRFSASAYADNQRVLLVDDGDNTQDFGFNIDGFTLANGSVATSLPEGPAQLAEIGGAILSREVIRASRLRLTGNSAVFGSAVCLLGGGGSSFRNIVTEGNFLSRAGSFYLTSPGGLLFEDCSFEGSGSNTPDASGAVYMDLCGNTVFRGCSFSNINTEGAGGGILVFNSILQLIEVTFDNINSSAGGAVFYQADMPIPIEGRDNWAFVVRQGSVTNCTGTSAPDFTIGGGFAVSTVAGDVGTVVNGVLVPADGVIDTVGSATVLIEGTQFNNNTAGTLEGGDYSGGAGGAVYLETRIEDDSTTIRIFDATFDGNSATNGGAVRLNTSADVFVDGCTFDDNKGIGGTLADETNATPAGAAINTNNDRGITVVTNTTFTGNTLEGPTSTFGGAVFIGAPISFVDDDNPDLLSVPVVFDNVTFEDNIGRVGGAIQAQGSYGIGINNSTFRSNGLQEDNGALLATVLGGAINAAAGDNAALIIENTTFTGNLATQGLGGAISQSGDNDANTRFVSLNNTYEFNGVNSGGSGGAISLRGNHPEITITDNDFLVNSADGDGGAIAFSAGGALDTAAGEFIRSVMNTTILRSYFSNNTADNQGGAISTQATAPNLINNIFESNSTNNFSGGAVSFNGNVPIDANGMFVDEVSVELEADIINNTFYNNSKGESDDGDSFGNQISLFQPGGAFGDDVNSLTVNLANNAFIRQGAVADGADHIAIEPAGTQGAPAGFTSIGMLTINSLGGNFINSASVSLDADGEEIFSAATNDIVSTTVDSRNDILEIFTDPDDDDFIEGEDPANNFALVCDDSPLINAGVAGDFLPSGDITGRRRVVGSAPDIGAIESDCDDETVSTSEPIENSGLAMTFYPNPTVDVLTIQNDEIGVTDFRVTLVDQLGRVMRTVELSGSNNTLDLSTVPAGIYNLQLSINGKSYAKRIVRL